MILFAFQIHIFKKPRKPIKTVEVGEIWAHSTPNYMMFNGSWFKILTMFYSAVLFSQVSLFFDHKNLQKVLMIKTTFIAIRGKIKWKTSGNRDFFSNLRILISGPETPGLIKNLRDSGFSMDFLLSGCP